MPRRCERYQSTAYSWRRVSSTGSYEVTNFPIQAQYVMPTKGEIRQWMKLYNGYFTPKLPPCSQLEFDFEEHEDES